MAVLLVRGEINSAMPANKKHKPVLNTIGTNPDLICTMAGTCNSQPLVTIKPSKIMAVEMNDSRRADLFTRGWCMAWQVNA